MTKFRQAELLASEIRNPRVREAFIRIDRRRFVPDHLKPSAWLDHALPINDNATISQPSLVAKMTEWLGVESHHHILEIGTGSGYQTAILSQLAAKVYSIEISASLSAAAQQRLTEMGYNNIQFRVGDGTTGWPEAAPFDRILATVAFGQRPTHLLEQLCNKGRCLAPVGPPDGIQWLKLYQKHGSGVNVTELIPVRFLSLL